MKRNVLRLFSLLLILLLYVTLVSPKVEEEMSTLVEARHGIGTKSNRNIVVGKIAITWKHSDDVLYNIVEGSGWESGLRVAEIPSDYYDLYSGHVELGAGTDYWYIYSASREPVPGNLVTLAEEIRKEEDRYLIWCPEKLENLDKLPNSMEILKKSKNAVLVKMRQATFPFFEHRIWYSLKDVLGTDVRIYSMKETEDFLKAIPWILGIFVILLSVLVLWWRAWKKEKWNRWNFVWIAVLLGLLPCLTNQFDLPASLMPENCILDFSHYIQTFKRIFSSLSAMDIQILSGGMKL